MDLGRLETIIIVMMENRSFDHVLGYLRRVGGRADIEGIQDDAWCARYENPGRFGSYRPYPLKRMSIPDPPHERDPIAMQIRPAPSSAVGMRGFVQSYARRQPPPDDESLVMGFYQAGEVPMADFFAQEFLVCDRWYCSLPTGTQPNRLMAMSGLAARDKNASLMLTPQDLVYDWLNLQQISWRVYHDGALPFFALMEKWQGEIARGLAVDLLGIHTYFRRLEHFDRDFVGDPTLPSVIFIEPEYTDGPHWTANDDHPPTSIGAGQAFLYSIYRTLMRRPDRWAKTLMAVTYDEHGGFFDHVDPYQLTTDPPPGSTYEPFHTTGVRVPTFLVSPFLQRRTVLKEPLDHTSLLGLLAERFTPGIPYSDAVARRAPLCDLPRHLRLREDLALADPRRDLPPPPPEARIVPPTIPSGSAGAGSRAEGATENARAFQEATKTTLAKNPLAAAELLPDIAHFIEAP